MEPCVVGIDSGTQGVRVVVFDLHGQVVAEGAAKHNPIVFFESGGAEQDPHDLWEKLCRASRQAMDSLLPRAPKLAAVSLAAQRSVVVAVDRAGQPLRPAFSWLDRRRADTIEAAPGYSAEQREQQVQSKANWLKIHEPQLFEKTARFISVSGWLTYRLCGQFRDSVGGLGGVFPLDINLLSWPQDPLMYELMGMSPERLPNLCLPGSPLGHITREAAQQTGLPEGLPLIAGAGDKSCELLGAGTVSQTQGYISYGSLASLAMVASSPIQAANGEFWTIPGAIPGTWNLEFGMECGYLMVDWFCQQFATARQIEGRQPGVSLEQVFSEQAADLPPGAGGLVLAPYWSRLGIAPGAQSVMVGIEKEHTPVHLFRAILEGIAFALREGKEALIRNAGFAPSELVIGGGGAQSDLAVQITADVLGLPVVRANTVHACALGAAIGAAVGRSLFQSYPEAVKQMCQRGAVFLPDPARQEVYEAIYTRLYRKLCPSLKQVFGDYALIFNKA